MIEKPILYFDMDNVLVDFQSGLDQVAEEEKAKFADDGKGKPHYDDIPGLFSLMKPMPGSIDAVNALAEKYDCYILSTTSQFGDHHIQFGTANYPDWPSVVEYLNSK